MRNLFTPRLNCELDTLMLSSAAKLTDIPAGSFARILNTETGTGTFLKNGADAGTVVAIANGDSLQIETRTSDQLSTPVFVAFEIAGEPGFFTTVTRSATTPKQIVGFNGLIPLSLTDSQTSTSIDYGDAISCVVSQYNAGDGTFIKTVPIPAQYEASGSAGLPFADYYSSTLTYLGPDYNIAGQVQLGMQPYQVIRGQDGLLWVSISTEDRIVAVDSAGKIVNTLPTGARPMGLAMFQDTLGRDPFPGRLHMMVANYAGGTLSYYIKDTTATKWTLKQTISVNHRLTNIAVDQQGVFWITSSDDGGLYQVNIYAPAANGTFSAVKKTFGNGTTDDARGIVFNPITQQVHISCTKTNKVVSIHTTTGVSTSLATPIGPYGIDVGPDGSVYAACFGSGVVAKIKDGAVKTSFSTDMYPYNVQYADGQLLVTNYYGLPAFLQDQLIEAFDIFDPPMIPQMATLATTPFRVSGIDAPTPVAVPNVYGAQLVKNGVVSGTRTTVANGDEISFNFVSPHISAATIDIPMFIGNQWQSFKSITTTEDTEPDLSGFIFDDLLEQALNTLVTSSNFTVLGIDTTVTLQVATDLGSVIVNGVNKNSTVADVKLGDVVAIQLRTANAKNEEQIATITIGTSSTTWRVTTVTKLIWWIRPELRGVGIYDRGMSPAIINKMVRRNASGARIEYDLNAAPTGEDIRNKQYLYIPSYYEDCVFRVTTNGAVAQKIQLAPGTAPFSLCIAPKVSKTPALLAAPLVTLRGANCVINLNFPDSPINLSSGPTAIVAPDDGSFVYVALPDEGKIAVLVPAGNSYTLSKYISVGGEPYDLTMWGTKVLYSDRTSNQLGVIDKQANTQDKMTVGYGVWDMEWAGTTLYTANSYDNTVSKINPAKNAVGYAFPVGAVPSTLCYVATTGVVLVGHYAQGEILSINHRDGDIYAGLLGDYTYSFDTSANTADGQFWPVLYSNLAFGDGNPDILTVETAMDKLVWEPQLDATRLTTVTSNIATVSNVTRTVKLNVSSSNAGAGYKVYKNGVQVSGSFYVVNGDKIKIDVNIPDKLDESISVTLSSYNVRSTFKVRSEGIKVMNPVVFDEIFGVKIRAMVTSNTVVVSGLSADVSTPLQVYNSEWVEWVMYKNGVLQPQNPKKLPTGILEPTTVMAKNGDYIALYGISRGQYNSVTDYILLSAGQPVGTLRVHNVLLDGVDDIHVVYREQHYLNEGEERTAEVLNKVLYESENTELIAEMIPRQTLVMGEEMPEPEIVPRVSMALAIVTREFVRQGGVSVAEVIGDRVASVGAGRAQVVSDDVRLAVQSFQANRFMVNQPQVERVVPKAFLQGPVKEYIYGEHEPGREADEIKWERLTLNAGVNVDQKEDEQKWARSDIHARTTVIFKYQRNRTPTPVKYSVQYERNALHALVQQSDVFEKQVQWTQRTWEPKLERQAQHALVTWVPQLERQRQHAHVTWEPQLERQRQHALVTWDPVVERKAQHEQIEVEAQYARRPPMNDVRVDEFETVRSASRGHVETDEPMEFIATQSARASLVTIEAPEAEVFRRSFAEAQALEAEDVTYSDPRWRGVTTAAEQGLFESEADARQYANDMGFTEVEVVAVGFFWTWNTVPKRQNANCAVIADKHAMPHKWYVHGG